MHIAITTLDTLIRPRLLVSSARYALRDYKREARLARILRLPVSQNLPEPEEALKLLLARERTLEHARKAHDASWNVAAHVAVMTALLHEARLCAMVPAQPAHLELVHDVMSS